MSVTENQIKNSIQQAIKTALVDSKYTDEPITFGQAMVTQHFLTQAQMIQQQQSHQESHIHNYQDVNTHTTSLADNYPKQVVQFDLCKNPQTQTIHPQYGRRRMRVEETKDIKQVFQWQGDDAKNQNQKRMTDIERSPSKWKTEQRDNYRLFVESPTKNNEIGHQVSHDDLSGGPSVNEQVNDEGKILFNQQQTQSRSVRISNQPGQSMDDQDTTSTRPDGKDDKKKVRGPSQSNSSKRPLSAQQQKSKNMKNRIDNLNSTTRWLPDSAFITYFGKPAFHIYGKGNTNPTVGGNIYGQYMLTHNVNPECGEHLPQYQQVYDTALDKGVKKNGGVRVPTLPKKVKEDIRLTPGELEAINKRNPIMPKDRKQEAKGLQRTKTIKIAKPDLTKERYFNSKHTTPNESMDTVSTQQNQTSKDNKQTIKNNNLLEKGNIRDEFKQIIPYQQAEQDNKENQHNVKNQVLDEIYHGELDLQDYEDIGEADQHQQCNCGQGDHNQQSQQIQQNNHQPLCQVPTSTQAKASELNPRNYQFLPACWTQRIRPAGKLTYKSENIQNVIVQGQTDGLQDTI